MRYNYNMTKRRFTYVVLLTGLLLACKAAPPPAPRDSGIEGQVKIGPMCPVIEEGTPCPDEPYEATIVVKDSKSGRQVATVQSGPDGMFHVMLAPGEYVLEPQSPNPGAPPYAEPQTVTVEADQFTYVEILYESGIR